MYVSALRAVGYRNLNTTIGVCHPLAVLVGENNAGKSNVIDALGCFDLGFVSLGSGPS
jgi:AAA15 family ATPase/GTPase